MKAVKYLGLFCMVLLLMYSCKGPQPEKKPKITIDTTFYPSFSGDTAFSFVAKQISYGPRVSNSEANKRCGDWLIEKLRTYTSDVTVQAFQARAYNGQVIHGRNIIASFHPEASSRILLASHWDSRPFADHDPNPANRNKPIDGANDGASGVGVLLELARIMHTYPPNIGVDIILFDAEDYGPPEDLQTQQGEHWWGLGSQYWSRNKHIPSYNARYGVLLDMVGVPQPSFLMEGFSMYYAPDVVKKIWDIAASLGYGKYFPKQKGGFITDDHYYVNKYAGIPMIDIIHLENDPQGSSFFEHWHTLQDNLEHVDPQSLQMVGDVLVRLIYKPQ